MLQRLSRKPFCIKNFTEISNRLYFSNWKFRAFSDAADTNGHDSTTEQSTNQNPIDLSTTIGLYSETVANYKRLVSNGARHSYNHSRGRFDTMFDNIEFVFKCMDKFEINSTFCLQDNEKLIGSTVQMMRILRYIERNVHQKHIQKGFIDDPKIYLLFESLITNQHIQQTPQLQLIFFEELYTNCLITMIRQCIKQANKKFDVNSCDSNLKCTQTVDLHILLLNLEMYVKFKTHNINITSDRTLESLNSWRKPFDKLKEKQKYQLRFHGDNNNNCKLIEPNAVSYYIVLNEHLDLYNDAQRFLKTVEQGTSYHDIDVLLDKCGDEYEKLVSISDCDETNVSLLKPLFAVKAGSKSKLLRSDHVMIDNAFNTLLKYNLVEKYEWKKLFEMFINVDFDYYSETFEKLNGNILMKNLVCWYQSYNEWKMNIKRGDNHNLWCFYQGIKLNDIDEVLAKICFKYKIKSLYQILADDVINDFDRDLDNHTKLLPNFDTRLQKEDNLQSCNCYGGQNESDDTQTQWPQKFKFYADSFYDECFGIVLENMKNIDVITCPVETCELKEGNPKARLYYKYSDTFSLFERRINLIRKMVIDYFGENTNTYIDSKVNDAGTETIDYNDIMMIENKLIEIYNQLLDCAESLEEEYKQYCEKYKNNCYIQTAECSIRESIKNICCDLVYVHMDIEKYRFSKVDVGIDGNDIDFSNMLHPKKQWFTILNDIDSQERSLKVYFDGDEEKSAYCKTKIRNKIKNWFERNKQQDIADQFMKHQMAIDETDYK